MSKIYHSSNWVGQVLKDWRIEKGLSIYDIALNAMVKPPLLYRFEKSDNPKIVYVKPYFMACKNDQEKEELFERLEKVFHDVMNRKD